MKTIAFDSLMAKFLKPSSGNPQLFFINTCGFERNEVVEIPLALIDRLVIIDTVDIGDEDDRFISVERSNVSFSQISGDKGLVLGMLSHHFAFKSLSLDICINNEL